MEPLQELLAVDQQRALEFFVTGLQDVSSPGVDRQELLYNASVLAHYAQVSTFADLEMPAPANLTSVFDSFVVNTSMPQEARLIETAGAQCLFLTGFFEDQIRWYAELGAGFFMRAAGCEGSAKRARLLMMIARHFEPWRQRHARLRRELRDQQYLLTPPSSLM
jgi:hypothetical protein